MQVLPISLHWFIYVLELLKEVYFIFISPDVASNLQGVTWIVCEMRDKWPCNWCFCGATYEIYLKQQAASFSINSVSKCCPAIVHLSIMGKSDIQYLRAETSQNGNGNEKENI